MATTRHHSSGTAQFCLAAASKTLFVHVSGVLITQLAYSKRSALSTTPLSRQLRKCKTDMYQGLEWDNPDRPECTNLLTIYQVSNTIRHESIWHYVSYKVVDPIVYDIMFSVRGCATTESEVRRFFTFVPVCLRPCRQ